MMRLDRFLANQGLGTRKEVKKLIRGAAVRVNGEIILKDGAQIDEERDEVSVNGEQVWYQRFFYLMLNKPQGVVCANDDGRHETVFDLLPDLPKGAFTVGRLDLDTTGLLLVTNDGALAHRLLAPRSHVDKVYLARVEGRVEAGDVEAFARGVTLEDGLVCMPAGLEPLGDGRECLVTLREGKFHQVKRMLAARGKPVLSLHRLSMGPLRLDGSLEPGSWRPLTEGEREELLRLGE